MAEKNVRESARKATGILVKRLQMAFLAQDRVRFQHELDRGKIDNRRLHALTEKTSNKVFKKRVEKETTSTAAYLLVDCSGSMGYNKIRAAREAACAFSDCLERIGIVHEVAGFWSAVSFESMKAYQRYKDRNPKDHYIFNRRIEVLHHQIVKPFDKSFREGKFAVLGSMVNNTDGESVRWAARLLARRLEKRKVLFVFSDGDPKAEGDQNLLYLDLKEAVKEIMRADIQVVGIGINTDAPSKFYPDYVVIDDITTLSSETVAQLEKILLKGQRGSRRKVA